MRVNFSRSRFESELVPPVRADTWANILRIMMREFSESKSDLDLDEWLEKTWSIRLRHDNTTYPSHISGLEIDDEYLTMVLLKYPFK